MLDENDEPYFDEEDAKAFKIFIQALSAILQPTEGVVVDIDGKIENRVVVWKNEEDGCIVIMEADEDIKKIDLKHGNLVWMHKTKDECTDAIIDDYIVKKEIEELTKGEPNDKDIRPSK